MKVGDLVTLKVHSGSRQVRSGVVVDVTQKKCWRTSKLGKSVAWDKIDPELHGTVLFEDKLLTLPAADLEVINDRS